MKTKPWLAISLAVNAVAIAALMAVALRSSPRPSSATTDTAVSSTVKTATGPAATPKPDAAEPGKAPGNWVEALRSSGVSETLVANVAAADFEDRWQKRMRDAQKQFDRGDLDEA